MFRVTLLVWGHQTRASERERVWWTGATHATACQRLGGELCAGCFRAPQELISAPCVGLVETATRDARDDCEFKARLAGKVQRVSAMPLYGVNLDLYQKLGRQ